MTLPKKIAVLMGGPGSERDVSLATGRGVAKALRSLGAEAAEVDVRDENFELPAGTELAFIALHVFQIFHEQAFERGSQPLRAFMQKNVREKDLKLFSDMAKEAEPAKPEDLSLRVLVPAFMISELKRAFEIGFLLFLPFLIIDLVVASVLMSMGMMMLPPVVVSLPFKLIFFVLVDGWSLVAGSLIQSYGG